tara:strand:- start:1143 stop:3581 length:2439 start_codon:yes stop_codon:yes gene_type:complete
MPDLEISSLPQLAGSDLQGTDPVALADISASETKKITVSDLLAKSVDFIADDSIEGDQIISLDGSKLLANSVTASQIAANAVGSSELADLAVDTAALQAGAVTDVKLASGIDGSKLSSGTVSDGAIVSLSGSKIIDGTVGAAELAANAVGSSELADDAVDTASVQNSAITDAKLASGISGSKLVTGSVTSAQLATNSVGSSELADDSVDTAAIQDAAVTDAKIASGISGNKLTDATVSTAKIQNSAITDVKLATGIDGAKIVSGSVSNTQLSANSVSSTELQSNSVDTAAIQNLAVTDAKLASGISGSKLTDASVSTAKIQALAITDAEISGVDGSKISAASIDDSKLASDCVTTSKIIDSAVTDAKLASGLDGSKLTSGSVGSAQLSTNSVTNTAILNGSVTDSKIAGPIDGSKLNGGTVASSALGAVTDRGLDQSTGSVGITNVIAAGTQGGISFNDQGLITAVSGSVPATDLPLATDVDLGVISAPTSGGLAVNATGQLSISNSVTAATVRGIQYDAHGSIVSVDPAIPASAVPIATSSAVGGVQVPGSDLSVATDGSLSIALSGVVAGTYAKTTVNNQGIVTAGSTLLVSDVPALDASKITSGQFASSYLATDSVTATKIADYAISFIQEAAPAINSDLHIGMLWLQESTAGLWMWNGNAWTAISLGRLSQENLRYCGTVNASTGLVDGITVFGTSAGYSIGDSLGNATNDRTGVYFVISTTGNNIPEASVTNVSFDAGDWVLCNGLIAGWIRIDTLSSGPGGGGVQNLDDLLDVQITSVADGEPLVYDSSVNQWVNADEIDGGVYFS